MTYSSRREKKKEIEAVDDIRNYDLPPGFGSIFVEFANEIDAKAARRNLHLLKYENRTVECCYWDEQMYADEKWEPDDQDEKGEK